MTSANAAVLLWFNFKWTVTVLTPKAASAALQAARAASAAAVSRSSASVGGLAAFLEGDSERVIEELNQEMEAAAAQDRFPFLREAAKAVLKERAGK